MRIILPTCRWNPKTDDLDWGDFGLKCVRWSNDYERSLLPKDLVFPQANQIWEAVDDCEVNFNAFFASWPNKEPFRLFAEPLPFGRARLSRGERVRIEPINEPKPIMIWFKPLRYLDLQQSIVPAEVLKIPHYSCYSLSLKLARNPRSLFVEPQSGYFSEVFRWIENTPSAE